MHKINVFLTLFATSLLLGSCRISPEVSSSNYFQKRKYKAGIFVISPFHHHKQDKALCDQRNEPIFSGTPANILTIAKNSFLQIKQNSVPLCDNQAYNVTSPNLLSCPLPLHNKYSQETGNNRKKVTISKIPNALRTGPMTSIKGPSKIHWQSLVSFIAGIICVLSAIALLVFPPTETLILVALEGVVWGGLGSIFFGAKSLNRIKKYPDQYKGKILSTIGLWCGLGITLLAFLFLLIAMMASGGEF